MNTCHDIICLLFLAYIFTSGGRRKTADAMRLPLQQFHFMYCFNFTLYCTVIVARINYLSRCERCRNFEISNQKETLMPHELPSRPWEKVGTDLFSLDGGDYLITVDYLSNF